MQEEQDTEDNSSFSLHPVTQQPLPPPLLRQVETAAVVLQRQWPRGGSISDYKTKLLGVNANQEEFLHPFSVSTGDSVALPCSFLLLHNGAFAGHGRLTACFEGAGGNAAAATYILAEPRGLGHGSRLMTLLEQEAKKLGYHYLYLWTTTAISFYLKLGYSKTERVSLYSACLKTLRSDQVGSLEAMLVKRTFSVSAARPSCQETVLLPPDVVTENDVWLRKRLVELVPSLTVPLQSRIDELNAAIQQFSQYHRWEYYFHSIPWRQQLGPSCGLAALRMLRDFYCHVDPNDGKAPSLLSEAQAKKYSFDGEVFDARNMVQLARFCGLDAELRSFRQLAPNDIVCLLKKGASLVLPYDSQAFTRRPWKNCGKSAHYGIIVGILLGFQREDPVVDDTCALSLIDMTNFHKTVDNSDCLLLLVQHSLSSKFSVATHVDFFESNQQLTSLDTTKCKLPDRGMLYLSDCVIVCHGPCLTSTSTTELTVSVDGLTNLLNPE
jgi:GNAT superfamily N-acetyltransferase